MSTYPSLIKVRVGGLCLCSCSLLFAKL